MSEVIARIAARIDDIEAEIGRDEVRLAAKRELLAGLREAIRRHGPGDTAEAPGDLSGMPIRDAAGVILAELREGAGYADVARLALARGYRSPKSGADIGKIAHSFYETMRRHPALFERDARDGGRFRLVAGRTPSP
jgi:hypothetical protein